MSSTARRSRRAAMAMVLGAALVAAASAQDRTDLDRTRIIGNRELPKVLHIMPWKKPLPGDLEGRPATSVLDDALAPVDREVFRRQIRYGAQFAPAPPRPLGPE